MKSQQTCSMCQKRPATHHVVQIINDREEILDFCADCFAERSKIQGLPFMGWDPNQKCYYCGGPAQSASTNMEPWREVRNQAMHYTCFRCFEYENELFLNALEKVPKNLSRDEEMNRLRALMRSIDSKVKKKFGKGEG